MTDDIRTREGAAVLALAWATGRGGDWPRTASLIEEIGSGSALIERSWDTPPSDAILAEHLASQVEPERLAAFAEMVRRLRDRGVRLVTVLDDDYPENLREIYNRPPFLFVRGDLDSADRRAIAVVGTRRASAEGLAQARRLATELAGAGVTVLSGLALGIDAAAHEAALAAGGRTVAVMGTGINRVYPREHASLAERIASSGRGALVSQFLPDASPARYSFPMRNVVMSGMGVGTVVVEASSTSGAKMQARLALEHGKRLFLVESLVMQEPWARQYAKRPGAVVVRSVDDVLAVVQGAAAPVEQLTFD